LRFENDRKALWKGLKDGTIDTIVTDHRPHNKEEKDIEFDLAAYGAIGLQTNYASLNIADEFELGSVINALAHNSRTILGLDQQSIEIGTTADLTLFQPEKEWKFKNDDIFSSTHNTPYVEKLMKGFVVGVINNGKLVSK
jgi:dihydroorotase